MAEISDEMLTFIVNKARDLHHGSIVIDVNADRPGQIGVEVVQKERFRTSEAISTPPRRPGSLPGGVDPESQRRRG